MFPESFPDIPPGEYPIPITTSKGGAYMKVVITEDGSMTGFDLFWDKELRQSWYEPRENESVSSEIECKEGHQYIVSDKSVLGPPVPLKIKILEITDTSIFYQFTDSGSKDRVFGDVFYQKYHPLEDLGPAVDVRSPQWIAVEERLPGVGTNVIAFGHGRVFECRVILGFGGKIKFADRHPENYTYREGSITHWMPLPPPPELEMSPDTKET